jgi:hypothetical protein
MSLEEFCSYLNERSGIRIFFPENLQEQLTITLHANGISVKEALVKGLEGSGLEVSEWNGSLLALKDERLPDSLPLYETAPESGALADTQAIALTQSEARYLTGRRADVTQTLTVGRKGLAGEKALVTIRGRITEEETGEPVIGATMYIEELKSGTASDHNGFLSLVIRTGHYTAVFNYLGLETRKYMLEVLSEGDFSVEMKKTVIQMKEVVVVGDQQMNIRSRDPGLEKVTVKSIKEIPMMLGERDILKVSEMLPGIVTVGEGSAGINVRGGNYDQNAFFINRIPIYNTSHLFGFFPAFNADIIKDFSIYKGHVPLQYGGKLSSVFNIIARQGNRKRFSARGSISPVAASLMVEGPLKKDVSSFLLSGRFLYSDWILHEIDDPVIRNSDARFNDFSIAWNYDLKKSQFSVFAYQSHDAFTLSDLNAYEYNNRGASVNFSHNFSTSFRGEFALAGGQYIYSTTDELEVSTAYRHSYKIGDYRFTADFSHELNEKNTFNYGLGLTLYKLQRGDVLPYGEYSLRNPVSLGDEQGLESALYFSDSYQVLPWLSLTAGIRLALFNPLGPATVYTYMEGQPVEDLFIEDSIRFGRGQAIRWYLEPDIRAALNFRTDEEGSVKVAFNQMHQNLYLLNNTIALAPNAQWKLADYHLEPARSQQFSAGIFRSFSRSGWEASLEFYYKKTSNSPEFKDGADFISTPRVETTLLPADQQAYGLEVLLRRSGRRLEGWLAYTYSRSIVKVDGEQTWDKINDGLAYPSNYDIPHVLNTVVNYHFSRRITASGVLSYQTGRPVTYPVSVYYINGMPFVDYSQRNEYRIPDYFRIDLSLTLEGNLRKKKLVHHSFTLGVYNVTGRDNPYSVYFTVEGGKLQSYKYSVIGVPVYTLTWLFKLGNYASD